MYHPPTVQLELPFLRASPEPAVRVNSTATIPSESLRADPVVPPRVEYVRVRSARRYILRVRADGTVRVTIPRGGSRAEAARFLRAHQQWIHRERQRVQVSGAGQPWTDGTTFLLRGAPVTIHVVGSGDRVMAVYADRAVPIPAGTELPDLRPFIERDLQALARTELPPRLAMLARVHGLTIKRVSIRNQRSRWGSCSPNGCIALNFRLIQMPPPVGDYVLLHELMHLKQQNHSVRYWRLVERICPSFREAERWLRTEGKGLF